MIDKCKFNNNNQIEESSCFIAVGLSTRDNVFGYVLIIVFSEVNVLLLETSDN